MSDEDYAALKEAAAQQKRPIIGSVVIPSDGVGLSSEARKLGRKFLPRHGVTLSLAVSAVKRYRADMKRIIAVVAAVLLLSSCATMYHWFLGAEWSKLRVGMHAEQVRELIPLLYSVNRSVTASGVHEQWVIEKNGRRSYLYLDDGVLTAWQQ